VIRVCLVAPGWMTGGQAVEARSLLDGFAADRHVRIELQPIDPRLPRWLAGVRGVRTLARLPIYLGGLIARVRRADVVHVFTAGFWPFLLTTTPAVLIGRVFGRPVILNYRDGRARRHIRSQWVRWVLRRATVLVFPSEFLQQVFAEFGLAGTVVPNTVDTRQFAYRERRPLRPVLLSNRLLEELYAVENTILAFERIAESRPDARLLIVGDGDQRSNLETLVAERRLRGVEFIGRVPHAEMPKWFDAADILVNSSRIDNMPHCIIEAFAAGLPVVTTPAGGIPYVVEPERNGIFVPIDDPAGMAAAIERLLDDDAFASYLIERARRDCMAQYAWPAAKKLWTNLYADLAVKRSVPRSLEVERV
jgi:L-malate glycosyltransferase